MLVLEVSGNWFFLEYRVEFPPNLACLPRDYVIESTWGWYIAIIPAVPKIMFVTPRPLGFGENRARSDTAPSDFSESVIERRRPVSL